jgi:hypothetical protein
MMDVSKCTQTNRNVPDMVEMTCWGEGRLDRVYVRADQIVAIRQIAADANYGRRTRVDYGPVDKKGACSTVLVQEDATYIKYARDCVMGFFRRGNAPAEGK